MDSERLAAQETMPDISGEPDPDQTQCHTRVSPRTQTTITHIPEPSSKVSSTVQAAQPQGGTTISISHAKSPRSVTFRAHYLSYYYLSYWNRPSPSWKGRDSDPIRSSEIAHATGDRGFHMFPRYPSRLAFPRRPTFPPNPPQQPIFSTSPPSLMAGNSTRLRALALYKELRHLGRDYPDPSCVHVCR